MKRRTVVLTGATSGIGRAAAAELILGGSDVIMISRTGERATAAEDFVMRAVEDKLAGQQERRAQREAVRVRSRARSERQARFDIPTGLAAAYAVRNEDNTGGEPDSGERPNAVAESNPAEDDSGQAEPLDPGSVSHVICDLASLESVRAAAATILARCDRIDVLINNAAVLPARRDSASEERDLAFEVNHLGHFLLTNLLLPRLEASAPARIIVVTCATGFRPARGNRPADRYGPHAELAARAAYDASKRANVLHARALDLKLRERGVDVTVVDPGRTATKLGSSRRDDLSVSRKVVHAVLWPLFQTPARAAGAIIRLADGTGAQDGVGRVYRGLRDVGPLNAIGTPEAATALWSVSEQLTGEEPGARE